MADNYDIMMSEEMDDTDMMDDMDYTYGIKMPGNMDYVM